MDHFKIGSVMSLVAAMVLGVCVITTAAEEEEGFTPLGNGKDMTPFVIVGGSPSTWSVAGDVIKCTGKPNGYFATRKPYGDCILRLDFKYPDKAGNSGYLMNITGKHKVFPKCVEVQGLYASVCAIFPLGGAKGPRPKVDSAARKRALKPHDEWNSIEIISRGGALTAILNGVKVCESEPYGLKKGPIGFQSEGAEIHFRNIRIKELAGPGEKIDFEPVADFPHVPDTFVLGACSGVGVDSQGQVYLFHRGKQPIISFDADGKYVRSWGDDSIGRAHGLRIDRDDNVWVTDIGYHLVLKFDREGKLLSTLGRKGEPGLGSDQFDQPTDVAFGPSGELYVSDGYGNSRVVKFSSDGKYLKSWGRPGKGPGEFNLPHTILVDAQGRVLVGDRENDRVQVFDGNGRLLHIWPGFAPFGLVADSDGVLFVADGRANKILRLNTAGSVVGSWGQKGNKPGEYDLPHMLAADRRGNLYVVEIIGERLQKLKRKS